MNSAPIPREAVETTLVCSLRCILGNFLAYDVSNSTIIISVIEFATLGQYIRHISFGFFIVLILGILGTPAVVVAASRASGLSQSLSYR